MLMKLTRVTFDIPHHFYESQYTMIWTPTVEQNNQLFELLNQWRHTIFQYFL